MGAGPSISELYINAGTWFKINMDKETYNNSFEQLDKDKDGGIGFQEFIGWVKERSAKYPDSFWQILEASDGKKERATSAELFRKKLDVDEFCRGLTSLCEMHGKDVELSREDMTDIFEILDINYAGAIGFVQICTYCTKFVDAEECLPDNLPESGNTMFSKNTVRSNLSKGSKGGGLGATNETKSKASKVLGIDSEAEMEAIKARMAAAEADEKAKKKGGGFLAFFRGGGGEKNPEGSISISSVHNVMGDLKNTGKGIMASMTADEKIENCFEQIRNKIMRENALLTRWHAKKRMEEAVAIQEEPLVGTVGSAQVHPE